MVYLNNPSVSKPHSHLVLLRKKGLTRLSNDVCCLLFEVLVFIQKPVVLQKGTAATHPVTTRTAARLFIRPMS